MNLQVPQTESASRIDTECDAPMETQAYDRHASNHCKSAILIWCTVGWIYAALTWRLLWLPGVLVFFPGIFVASLIAAIFFIPLWLIMSEVRRSWEIDGDKRWGSLALATVLKLGGLIGPAAGAIGYVRLLRLVWE